MADGEVHQHGPVHVHRFNRPQAVSIGSGGWSLPSCTVSEEPPSTAKPESSTTAPPPASVVTTAQPSIPQTSTVTAPRFEVTELCHNGNNCEAYFWSQDKQHVVLSVPVPAGTRAKSVKVDIQEEFVSVQVAGETLVKGKTRLPVNTDDDYTDWELVDWERGSSSRRLVRVTLIKKVPPGGISVVLWWPKLLDSEPEIDVAAISERSKNHEEHRKVWQAAHEQFREQVKKKGQIDVLSGGDDEQSE